MTHWINGVPWTVGQTHQVIFRHRTPFGNCQLYVVTQWSWRDVFRAGGCE